MRLSTNQSVLFYLGSSRRTANVFARTVQWWVLDALRSHLLWFYSSVYVSLNKIRAQNSFFSWRVWCVFRHLILKAVILMLLCPSNHWNSQDPSTKSPPLANGKFKDGKFCLRDGDMSHTFEGLNLGTQLATIVKVWLTRGDNVSVPIVTASPPSESSAPGIFSQISKEATLVWCTQCLDALLTLIFVLQAYRLFCLPATQIYSFKLMTNANKVMWCKGFFLVSHPSECVLSVYHGEVKLCFFQAATSWIGTWICPSLLLNRVSCSRRDIQLFVAVWESR